MNDDDPVAMGMKTSALTSVGENMALDTFMSAIYAEVPKLIFLIL